MAYRCFYDKVTATAVRLGGWAVSGGAGSAGQAAARLAMIFSYFSPLQGVVGCVDRCSGDEVVVNFILS